MPETKRIAKHSSKSLHLNCFDCEKRAAIKFRMLRDTVWLCEDCVLRVATDLLTYSLAHQKADSRA